MLEAAEPSTWYDNTETVLYSILPYPSQVQDVNNPDAKAALKAESNFVAGGSVLKMEVEVDDRRFPKNRQIAPTSQILSRLKEKDHYARLLGSGKRDRYQYMVMTLLGESLGHLFK